MAGKKMLKILTFSLVALMFILTFSFLSACKTGSETGTAAETETEEVNQEESMEEEEDMAAQEEMEEEEDEAIPGYIDVTAEEAKELIDNNPDLLIIDVSPSYDAGHIPGAVNYYIGDGSLDNAIPDLDPEAMYLVYCHVDSASIGGAQKLVDAGFTNVYRLAGNFAAWVDAGYDVEKPEEEMSEMVDMSISSPAFDNNGDIPAKYSCDADNINPELVFEGVPSDAVSLVLIVDDPDAPGGTWVHWTVWNIDPGTISIAENSAPAGSVQGNTDFGVPGYGGPCPPSGEHRYFFKLFALDTTLDLAASATASDIESAMEGHILASAELVGLYAR